MAARIDLTGRHIGDLEVLEYLGHKKYRCLCSCGNECIALADSLRKGYTTSCYGCKEAAKFEGLVGKKFGEWRVLEYLGRSKYRCQCSCGKIGIVGKYDLENGCSTSCGHIKLLYKPGDKVREWEVVRYIGNKRYLCQCSCGIQKVLTSRALVRNLTVNCGHTNPHKLKYNLEGRTFGEWKVLSYAGKHKWRCQCSCGTIKDITGHYLITGISKSCGHATNSLIDLTKVAFDNIKCRRYLGNGYWEVECKRCGNIFYRSGKLLRLGGVSCPECFKRDIRIIKSKEERTQAQIEATLSKENLEKFIGGRSLTYKKLAKELGLAYSSTVKICNRFGIENITHDLGSSDGEKELVEFIKGCLPEGTLITLHDRSILGRREIDIFIPGLKIGFEYDGVYWHSSEYKKPKYHQEKTLDAMKAGVRLIHIFEYEWLDCEIKPKIESYIKSVLMRNNKIFGRETEVRAISSKETAPFLEAYHLQSAAHASVHLGLYLDEILLGVMTLGRPRFNQEYTWEVIRVCFLPNTTVIGGTAKLWKFFQEHYNKSKDSVITYVDLSKFTGDSYRYCGFEEGKPPISVPGYVWVSSHNFEVIPRYRTTKQKLIDDGLGKFGGTEDEIMKTLGYLKIYDSGNLRLEWKNKVVESI